MFHTLASGWVLDKGSTDVITVKEWNNFLRSTLCVTRADLDWFKVYPEKMMALLPEAMADDPVDVHYIDAVKSLIDDTVTDELSILLTYVTGILAESSEPLTITDLDEALHYLAHPCVTDGIKGGVIPPFCSVKRLYFSGAGYPAPTLNLTVPHTALYAS